MIKVNRSVRIEWRNNPSSFELRNKDAFRTDFLRLGSAVRPVNELLSRSEEMRVLLPTVVGVSPIDSSWQERISTYLNDFLLEVPIHGLTFDISYVLDMEHPNYKANIDALIERNKRLNKISNQSGVDLEKAVLDIIKGLDETELYKYVTFVNIPDYISWRYCLLSSKVANKVEDINKSVNIQFFLTSDDERKAIKAARTRLRTEALTKYTTLVNGGDSNLVDWAVIAVGKIGSYAEFKGLSKDDKETILLELVDSDPKRFMEILADKHLDIKAKISSYIWMNILKVLPNSSIIVETANPENIIGNNMNEAVTYFANDNHQSILSEWNAKYKSLKG